MKKCEYCNKEHDSTYGSGRFCNNKCARGFSTKIKRNEINEKVSKKLIGIKTNDHIYSEEKWKIIKEKRNITNNNKILNADFSSLQYKRLKKRIILEQNEKCNKCGLNEWLGEKLIFELEHIDGNHHNNERNNLEALCPNCHSLTPTWRGRNKKKNNKNKVTDDMLFKALLKHNFNMRQALLSVGLAAKGGNYCRCHKLKKEYEIILALK